MRTLMIAILLAGCGGAGGAEGLNPAGPPEVLQVFVRERVDGALTPHLAFGDHPDIPLSDDDRHVTDAVARDGQRIRIVVDELLLGNRLEEVACADGNWSRVPDDATYDDVAACAGANLSRCHGICIGPDGKPVGILDQNGDGAFDDTRLIDGAVVLTCGGTVVPLDRERSYYQPSGSQRLSTVGPDSLGPAVAIVPAVGMPPGSTCSIAFAPEVVDHDGNRICAPSGDTCTPGDTHAISFQVEPLVVATADTTGAAIDQPIRIQLNATIDPASLGNAVSVSTGDAAIEGASAAVDPADDATLAITVPGGLTAGTSYAVTVHGGDAGIADLYGDHLAADASITWSTQE